MEAAGGPQPLDRQQIRVWRAGWGIAAVVLLALVVAGEVAARLRVDEWPIPTGALAAPVAIVAALVVWRVPQLAFDRWRYELAETTLELERGLLVHTHTAIPYFRVQHIDITRSPIERALGLSQLVVRTAAASTDATIPGVAVADADRLRQVILARTGRGDAV